MKRQEKQRFIKGMTEEAEKDAIWCKIRVDEFMKQGFTIDQACALLQLSVISRILADFSLTIRSPPSIMR